MLSREPTWSDLCFLGGRERSRQDTEALPVVLESSGEHILVPPVRTKGERWTGEGILPLKTMGRKDEPDTEGPCGILLLENPLNWGYKPSLLSELHIYI